MTFSCPDEVRKAHPWACNKIKGMWGSIECREFLHQFMLNDQGDDQVLSFDTLKWVNHLVKQHDIEFPQYSTTKIPFQVG